jgi:hypothetical protein
MRQPLVFSDVNTSVSNLLNYPKLVLKTGLLALFLGLNCSIFAQSGSVVTVNSDNVLVVNGKKAFLIGFSPGPPNYGVTPTGKDALQELRDAGALLFRITQNSNWDTNLVATQQAALDWAAQHGMYGWVNLRELSEFSATDTNTPLALRNLVDTFRNHPALGLWKNFDEAWWGGVSEADLQRGYEVIKQEDTNHPVVQTHAPRGTVSDLQPYNAAADVLAVDVYPIVAGGSASNPPITNTQVSQVGDWTKELSQVANGQKEYWMIEQIAFSGTTPPSHTLVYPTFLQSRFMAYQAIINGARGVLFFGGNIAATLNAQDAPLGWNWTFWSNTLKQVVLELGDKGLLTDALVAPNSALPITMSGTTPPDVEFCVREAGASLYILASKREGPTVSVTFTNLPPWAINGVVLYESPRTVTASSGQFTDSFAQWDVHVYRFSQSNLPPVIIFPPQPCTNNISSVASLSVIADGSAPLVYQWRKNGTNFSSGGDVYGTATSTLVLSNVTPADAAAYQVVVTGFGAITSTPASLTIISNQLPTIISQPVGRTNFAGTTATFIVYAVNPGPLSYQWRKNGANVSDNGDLAGSLSASLIISNASLSDAAVYDVIVTGFNSITSSPAVLAVLQSPTNKLFLYEPFAYTNLGAPVSSNTPSNWSYGGTGTNDLKVAPGNLSWLGLPAPQGNSVTNGGVGLGVRRLFGTNISAGVLYFSALFRINDLGNGIWNGAATQVGAFTAPDSTSFRLQVMVQLLSPTTYLIGVEKGGTGATATFDGTPHSVGETVFLVGKYDFTVSSNRVSLWINPDPSAFGGPEPATGFISATTGPDGFTIDRFNMRQNTAASVPAVMQWDELRVGLPWAAVTPPAPPIFVSLSQIQRLANGTFQFAYTNSNGSSASVFASTNLINWVSLGAATQISTDLFQFTDGTATNFPRRYYKVGPL